jgi:5-methylcytosine-specific restriction endonuclease McrA
MKKPVNDALVAEYAKRLRTGAKLGQVFTWPVPECDFTESQKSVIKQAQDERAKLGQKPKPQPSTPVPSEKKLVVSKPVVTVPPPATKTPSLSKLEKMLYRQQNKCFFCGEKLPVTEANIEHLHPLSLGGTRTEDNEVVCHKSLNETFGNQTLKWKFEFVLKAAGSFQCPKK